MQETYISIHAPTRGATINRQRIARMMGFQSTLPQGERRLSFLMTVICLSFQSTLPQGERQRVTTIVESAGLFQSTLPQGERRSSRISPGLSENFNPRSHKGSDVLTVKSFAYIVISIHAPTRGATYSVISLMAVPCYFNPRSHKGSDLG